PDDSDITGGDALNALARELTGPSFGLSTLRSAPVRVPARVLERVPLCLARAGVVIAPDRLRVEGRWPAPLQVPAFAAARRAFEQAVAALFDEAAESGPITKSVAAVERAAVKLRREVEAAALETPSAEWAPTRAFAIRL